jgi:hypothetical protein
MSFKNLLTVLPCAALCAALASPSAAQEQSGMVVVRDAQTGQLRAPTAAESRALAPPARSSAAMAAPSTPTVVTHPGGSRQVKLGERSLVYSVVTRDADGKLHDQCVQGAAAADKAVHAPAPAQHKEHTHD